ncbi:hypothetical protein BFT35_02920 [Thermoanaerobacterium thermosaccharolyticum]|uniref:hypothetical protein n=1 Tax=Thermoanaerobacterium thermosaccharolyticum TaxID=1517 RepID=UPI000C073582|nr:hypothetical protein [Thermoanaerobacterium thermosaccharolyticum]PHO08021.1 hypothetical protein BFT35_02920 [Thermoanaerobacterium thermosaccharolyticum]
MNKKLSKIFIVIMIIISIFMLSAYTPQYPTDTTVNLKGANHYWLVFLTIVVPHYSELMIQPFNEDFVIPDEINVDIVINNKRLFTGRLRYIPDPKFKFGQYKVELKSDEFYKKYKNQKYTVIIKYDNKSSTVLLNQCEIY